MGYPMYLLSLVAVPLAGGASGPPQHDLGLWEKFRAMAAPEVEDQSAELAEEMVRYVRALSPDDLLSTARQGCVAGAHKKGLTQDWEKQAAAESNAALCLEVYFAINARQGDSGQQLQSVLSALVRIVGDPKEDPCLRRIVLKRLAYSRKTAFQDAMTTLVAAHVARIGGILVSLAGNEDEAPALRQASVNALQRAVDVRIDNLIRQDDAVIEEMKELRSGDRMHGNLPRPAAGRAALSRRTRGSLAEVDTLVQQGLETLAQIAARPNASVGLRKAVAQAVDSWSRHWALSDDTAMKVMEAKRVLMR